MDWNGEERRTTLEERLRNVEIQLARQNSVLEENLKTLNSIISRHDHTLYGNGSDGHTTIIERIAGRVNSLEGHKETTQKHALAAWAALLGIIGKFIYDGIAK